MGKFRMHIAVIEPSDLIFEGLVTLLHKQEPHFYIYRLQDLEELPSLKFKEGVRVVIINPITLQNRMKVLQRIRKLLPEVFWIGMVSTLLDQDLMSRFDEAFSIVDRIEDVVEKINRCCRQNGNSVDRQGQLTERETDVLIELVKGCSNKEIAATLNISIHTVITHRKNITEKTGIKSLPGLTIFAITRNLISVNPSAQPDIHPHS